MCPVNPKSEIQNVRKTAHSAYCLAVLEYVGLSRKVEFSRDIQNSRVFGKQEVVMPFWKTALDFQKDY